MQTKLSINRITIEIEQDAKVIFHSTVSIKMVFSLYNSGFLPLCSHILGNSSELPNSFSHSPSSMMEQVFCSWLVCDSAYTLYNIYPLLTRMSMNLLLQIIKHMNYGICIKTKNESFKMLSYVTCKVLSTFLMK